MSDTLVERLNDRAGAERHAAYVEDAELRDLLREAVARIKELEGHAEGSAQNFAYRQGWDEGKTKSQARIAALEEALREADRLISLVHDRIYESTFDQKKASDAVWDVHRVVREILNERAEQITEATGKAK